MNPFQNAGEEEESTTSSKHQQSLISTLSRSKYSSKDCEDNLWMPPPTPTCLFGRNEEHAILLRAFNRASSGVASEVCLVSGESGVGKSSLVNSLRGEVIASQGFFVSGKFDPLQRDPYSALVAAFTDLVDLITQEEAGGLERLLSKLEGLVGSDLLLLTTLITNLPLPNHLKNNNTQNGDDEGHNQAFTRLKRLAKFFLQAASSPDRPILLLLDDLQWCDASSLEVIKALMADINSKHVLLVLTFRDDEEYLGVSELLVQNAHPTSLLRLTELKLTNLNETFIAAFVEETMPGLECVDEVAAILKSKTGGNPYVLLRFVEMAREKGFLYRSEQETWMCDVERFQNETHVSENLADLVTSRLCTLEPKVLELLTVASALGYLLDMELLYRVAVSEKIITADAQNDMSIMMQTAVQHGFIERSQGGFDFKFS